MLFKYSFYEYCESTQILAHKNLHQLSPNIINKFSTIRQMQGQGTHGRLWVSPPGGYYTSFAWLTSQWLDPELSVDLANIICQALKVWGVSAGVKYPNDIMIDRKKVAGILVEQEQWGHLIAVVIGIGMNIHSTIHTSQPTISLSQLIDITVMDVDQLIDRIIWEKVFLESSH